MSFSDVLVTVAYVVVSLAVVGAALYVLTCVALLVALALKELWYKLRYGRKKR